MKLFITLFVIFLSNTSYASQEIKFHDAGNNTYVAKLVSSNNIGETKGLEIIANAARKKCGSKTAHFGKYRFSGQEQISINETSSEETFRMIQQLFCGELSSKTQEKTKLLTELEKNKLESQARNLTDLYLDYLAMTDFKKAYSLLSTTLKENKAVGEWERNKKQVTSQPGELLQSEIWRVTTYIDPPSSAQKGVYIATDFDRKYTQAPIFCGYLVWYLEGDELKLVREDIGKINSDQFSEVSLEDLTVVKAKFRCKPLTAQ